VDGPSAVDHEWVADDYVGERVAFWTANLALREAPTSLRMKQQEHTHLDCARQGHNYLFGNEQ